MSPARAAITSPLRADKIVAEPATLTGSIGVLAGKLVVGELLHKLGITDDSAERGANAGMFSVFEDFSPDARQRLDAFLDETYRGFKERVAAGRHLSEDQVEAAGQGTGVDRRRGQRERPRRRARRL